MGMYENGTELDKEVARLIEKMSKLDPTSEQYKTVRASLHTLYTLREAQYKIEVEDDQKRTHDETEQKLKEKELELDERKLNESVTQMFNELQYKKDESVFAEKKHEAEMKMRERELEFEEQKHRDDMVEATKQRRHDWIITAVASALSVTKLVAVILHSKKVTKDGYKFEETGSVTSTTFREARKSAIDMIKDVFKSK